MRNLFALGKYLGAGAAVALIAQPAYAQVVSITGVQLVPTEQGLELVLEVPSGTELEVSSSRTGNTFMADISNTQLILPGGKPFEQANPAPGISSVTVIPLSNTQVRVTVVGEQEGLVSKVNQTPQSLIFDVSTSSASSDAPTTDSDQVPETAPPEATETPPPSPEGQAPTTDDPDPTGTEPPAAGDPTADEDELEIVVTATRSEEDTQEIPRSVTVIKREDLEQEALFNNDITQILGNSVPGLAPPTANGGSRSFNLRGRPAQFLVDGVPQDGNATSGGSPLTTIDTSAIERIEVVRGASANFGDGGRGGVINIITRSPLQEDGQKFNFGLTLRPDLEDDSFGARVDAGVTAKKGKVDFLVNTGLDFAGPSFDGGGNRIPPNGIKNETRTLNVLAKLGIDISETQRLQFSYNFFDNRTDSEFIADPDSVAPEGLQPVRARRIGQLEYNSPTTAPFRRQQNANITYRNEDLLGSELNLQAFFRKTDTVSPINDVRPLTTAFGGNLFFPFVTQGDFDSLEVGGRFQVDTPITERLSVLWGADLSYEELEDVTLEVDSEAFDNDREIINTREFTGVPRYSIRNIGTFGQLTWDVTDNVSLSGGVRYENIRLSADDYTAGPFNNFGFRPQPEIEGGTLTVDDFLFNAGVVFKATEEISLFGSFSQGFSIPDVGNTLGNAQNSERLLDLVALDPQKVNNFELGLRGEFDTLTLSLAGFLSTSELGSALRVNELGFSSVVRAPQRNYGLEFSADWEPSDRWRLGTTFTWNEGDNNPDDDDEDRFIPLSSVDIQPFKATVYLENETLPGWRNRIQALFVGGRDRAFDAEVDQFQVTGYTLVDLFSTINIGPGKLQLGIQNLFDREYLPVSSQERAGNQEIRRFPGEGRTFSIRYSFEL